MKAVIRASLLLPLVMLAACGKKGPLYLPDRGGDVVTRPVATPPAQPEATPPDAEGEKKKQQGATPQTPPQQ